MCPELYAATGSNKNLLFREDFLLQIGEVIIIKLIIVFLAAIVLVKLQKKIKYPQNQFML